MDWLRRNWPDLLIGMALVAVIAGIVTTLLSGGSFLPLGGQQGPVESARTPATQEQEASPLPPGLDERSEAEVESIIPVRPGADERLATEPDRSPALGEAPTRGDEVTITPEPPGMQQTVVPPTEDAEAILPDDAAEPTEAAAEPPRTDVAQLAQAGSYRVMVGTFSSQANAERRVAEFVEEGYQAFVGRQGDWYLALVGPFEQEAAAREAAASIRDSGIEPEALVFELTPDTVQAEDVDAEQVVALVDAPGTAVEEAEAQPATERTETVAEPAAAPVEMADNGARRFLQVGAYLSRQHAEPQLEQMQELGYEVTIRELARGEDETLYRLLIGPFAPTELQAVQERLSDRDIEHFATD